MNNSLISVIALPVLLFAGYTYNYRQSVQLIFQPMLPAVEETARVFPPQIAFTEKIWLHRVNTIPRAKHFERRYRGFEMDIYFDQERRHFDVRHPPDPSTGTCLKKMFEALEQPEERLFWLDFKNRELGDIELEKAVSLLDEISTRYRVKRRIIFESTNSKIARRFSDAGYYVSFYLPSFNVTHLDNKEIERRARDLLQQVAQSRASAVSGHQLQYAFMKQYFPNHDLLLFEVQSEPTDLYRLVLRERILEDPQVRVFLAEE